MTLEQAINNHAEAINNLADAIRTGGIAAPPQWTESDNTWNNSSTTIVDNPSNIYELYGFSATFPKRGFGNKGEEYTVWASIARVTKDCSLMEPSAEGPLVINQNVRSEQGRAVGLKEGDIVLAFPQHWSVKYDSGNEFVEFIGTPGDTTYRGAYVETECIEWIHLEEKE